MAEENLEWLTIPAVINQTVMAVKNYLDGKVVKCETWIQFNKSIKLVFASNSQFQLRLWREQPKEYNCR